MTRIKEIFDMGMMYANNEELTVNINTNEELVAFNAGVFRANQLGANTHPLAIPTEKDGSAQSLN